MLQGQIMKLMAAVFFETAAVIIIISCKNFWLKCKPIINSQIESKLLSYNADDAMEFATIKINYLC